MAGIGTCVVIIIIVLHWGGGGYRNSIYTLHDCDACVITVCMCVCGLPTGVGRSTEFGGRVT